MFYSFGALGFVWVFFWIIMYREVRGSFDEEFIQPPKVIVVWYIIICVYSIVNVYVVLSWVLKFQLCVAVNVQG